LTSLIFVKRQNPGNVAVARQAVKTVRNEDNPPPVLPDKNGYYPVPILGQWVKV
jgi:hypothetical protein